MTNYVKYISLEVCESQGWQTPRENWTNISGTLGISKIMVIFQIKHDEYMRTSRKYVIYNSYEIFGDFNQNQTSGKIYLTYFLTYS